MTRRSARRGSNAMEFAITFPVFLWLTLGMVEFGWYFSRVALVNSAAMDGCRAGSLVDEDNPSSATSPPGGTPAQVASARMTQILTSGGITCTDCSATITGTVPNKYLECTTEIQIEQLTNWMSMPTSHRSESKVRLEWQRN